LTQIKINLDLLLHYFIFVSSFRAHREIKSHNINTYIKTLLNYAFKFVLSWNRSQAYKANLKLPEETAAHTGKALPVGTTFVIALIIKFLEVSGSFVCC
jgi:hypothetical protein